jgi:hypothetical protein
MHDNNSIEQIDEAQNLETTNPIPCNTTLSPPPYPNSDRFLSAGKTAIHILGLRIYITTTKCPATIPFTNRASRVRREPDISPISKADNTALIRIVRVYDKIERAHAHVRNADTKPIVDITATTANNIGPWIAVGGVDFNYIGVAVVSALDVDATSGILTFLFKGSSSHRAERGGSDDGKNDLGEGMHVDELFMFWNTLRWWV